MKDSAPPRSDGHGRRPVNRRDSKARPITVARLDLELPDGRYLLVYSRERQDA